jgi:hypothetical protein
MRSSSRIRVRFRSSKSRRDYRACAVGSLLVVDGQPRQQEGGDFLQAEEGRPDQAHELHQLHALYQSPQPTFEYSNELVVCLKTQSDLSRTHTIIYLNSRTQRCKVASHAQHSVSIATHSLQRQPMYLAAMVLGREL